MRKSISACNLQNTPVYPIQSSNFESYLGGRIERMRPVQENCRRGQHRIIIVG